MENIYYKGNCTFVRIYMSFRTSFDKLKRGFPLSPPLSFETGFICTTSGLEMVVFDII